MRPFAAIVLTLGLLIPFSSATSAHHSFASQFDDRVAVTLHGVVASAEISRAPTTP